MIGEITLKNSGQRRTSLNYLDFEKLLLELMIDKLLMQEENTAKLRKLFTEADTDYSGFLTADELYGVFLKLKIDVKFEEMIELMAEF